MKTFLLITILLIFIILFGLIEHDIQNKKRNNLTAAGSDEDVESKIKEQRKIYSVDHLKSHNHAQRKVNDNNGNRAFSVEQLSWSPRVFLIRGLLSIEETEHMMKLGEGRLSRSLVAGTNSQKTDNVRTSSGVFIYTDHTDKIYSDIEERIADVTRIPIENQEAAYLLRYEKGQQYKQHWDYFDPAYYEASRWLGSMGQRCATVVTYLQHPEEGGETMFPKIDLKVMPSRGDAVLFYNTHPNGTLDPMSLHGGSPVVRGTKFVFTKWLREKPTGQTFRRKPSTTTEEKK